jgi:predicted RNA-binding Zn-ribbon protein involved in translation (DUF1610 family)
MRLFGHRSPQDREHLVATLRSLGPTSVNGLSAALTWSERRTTRVVREAIRWGRGAVRFDPVTGRVGFLQTAQAPAPMPPVESPVPARPPAPSPPPLPKAWGASPKCPSCQLPFVSTGTGSGLYCPQCGRLAIGGAPTAPAPPVVSGSLERRPPTTLGTDRRSQEAFAAWVSAQPIPCPKCRTVLRHRGVGHYGCPACGAQVAFERPAGFPSVSTPSPAPPEVPAR